MPFDLRKLVFCPNLVAIDYRQFESIGSLVQAESVRDHKIGPDPAFADQVDYGIDAHIPVQLRVAGIAGSL
jgi:hypothetical protein